MHGHVKSDTLRCITVHSGLRIVVKYARQGNETIDRLTRDCAGTPIPLVLRCSQGDTEHSDIRNTEYASDVIGYGSSEGGVFKHLVRMNVV